MSSILYIVYCALFAFAGLEIFAYTDLKKENYDRLANVSVGLYVFFMLSIVVNYMGGVIGV